MEIKFFKTKRQINALNEVKDVYLATIETGEVVDIDEISEQIEKISTVSKADVLAVLSALETTMMWAIEKARPVKLKLLGTFYPILQAEAKDTPEEVTKATIKRYYCVFKPSKYLKDRWKNIDFVLGSDEIKEVAYKKKK